MSTQAHLNKVLRHAERELSAKTHAKPTALLDLYRRFLKKEEHRLQLAHKAGEGGRIIAQQRANLITVLLQHVWKGAWQTSVGKESSPKICLLAVGGFGRGELNPFSDIDILFLYTYWGRQRPKVIDGIVEQVLYMLWDVGFQVGHASRTIEEQIKQCNEDLYTKTALLEKRFIQGDRNVFEEFDQKFVRYCLKGKEKAFIQWRMEDQQRRHQKYENTVFLQEPHIKNGCGGLRDYQNLLWMAQVRRGLKSIYTLQQTGDVTTTERKQLDHAYDFLLRVRNELHYIQKRSGDILTLRLQGVVANNFKYQHRKLLRRIEALMRDYFHHANKMYLLTDSLSKRLAGQANNESNVQWSFFPRRVVPSKKIDGFILRKGILEAEKSSLFDEDPFRLLRVFVTAQKQEAEIGPDLGFLIRRHLQLINRTFIYHKTTRALLRSLFSYKGRVGSICRRMHEFGVLGKIFPEFRPLTCLVQHEFFHRYTADEHTLVCLEALDRILTSQEPLSCKYLSLMQQVEKTFVLYLAMLLHDTGRSENTKIHSQASSLQGMRVGRRLKLPSEELRMLIFLIDHHTTLAETARRKNIEDHETILKFSQLMEDQERLDLLMLMTFADGQGVGSAQNHASWRDLLHWQLYSETSRALAGREEFLKATHRTVKEKQEHLINRLKDRIETTEIMAHFQNMPPRYLKICSESLVERHLLVVHDFFLSQIMQEDRALQPILYWEDYPDQVHSELTVVTWDRERSFAKLTGAMACCGLSVLSAEIFTRADDVIIDTFRVADERWQAVTDSRDKKAFEKILNQALNDPGDPFKKVAKQAPKNPLGVEKSELITRVSFDQSASQDYTLMDVQTPDRTGLLYRIASLLAQEAVQISGARITTEKGVALDTFYLSTREGKKLSSASLMKALAQRLKKELEA